MSSKIIYEHTHAANWPALPGTEVTITARQERTGGTVLLEWQRNDFAESGRQPSQIALTAEELRTISDIAVQGRDS